MMSTPEPPVLAEENDTEPNEDEGVLIVPDAYSGDKRIKWKRGDSKSIEKARARFEKLKEQGYAFFAIKRVRLNAFPKSNGTELVATKTPGKRGLVEETALVPRSGDAPDGEQIRHFEPDQAEIHAVPPRAGG